MYLLDQVESDQTTIPYRAMYRSLHQLFLLPPLPSYRQSHTQFVSVNQMQRKDLFALVLINTETSYLFQLQIQIQHIAALSKNDFCTLLVEYPVYTDTFLESLKSYYRDHPQNTSDQHQSLMTL